MVVVVDEVGNRLFQQAVASSPKATDSFFHHLRDITFVEQAIKVRLAVAKEMLLAT